MDDVAFTVYRHVDGAGVTRFRLTTGGVKPSDDPMARQACKLKLQNVGLGVARDVRLLQTVDGRAFAEKLSAHEKAIGGRIWADERSIEFEGESSPAWTAFQGYEARLGSFAPAATGNAHEFSVLWGFEGLVALYAAAACPRPDRKESIDWHVPPLTVVLAYRDLEGRDFRKTMQVFATFGLLQGVSGAGPVPGWEECGSGSFEVRDE